ncbi:MAG: hypothetical protein Kow0074_05560 [Candidatus Zixiibacteriota bacterium]
MTSPSRTRVVCMTSAKGGIGQSTISLDWARAVGRQGRRCLLIELAGGDLAWQVGATPEQFAEEVASGTVTLDTAAVRIDDHVSLLASGNAWSIYGPDRPDEVAALVRRITAGRWEHAIIDLGNASRAIALAALAAVHRRVILLEDTVASVARTYALLRALGDGVLADNTALVFNRIDNSTDAKSLLERFSQLTSRFLNRTWPLLGTVPDGASEVRVQAIAEWGTADVPGPAETPASIKGGISNRPFWADN